ncbi:hypothetical protein G3446_26350 [Thiorhodococcus minor]|uniref:Uncharacterized protein n=2 Tax=Thiorhodococcus minor TaxID=57489 RepID=A0A6M0K6B2_9GAMM|nr:hypothetical protein [Thiorhodococcus minor]
MMTPKEIAWRLLEVVRLKTAEAAFRSGVLGRSYIHDDPSTFRFCIDLESQLPSVPFTLDARDDEIEASLVGIWPALGFDWSWSSDGAVWHRAPDTGRNWPQVFFGKISYRQGNPFGDARVVWEPSRLQQLVTLALIARRYESERARAVDLIVRQLQSWYEANPVACGIHYVSAMECGLRIIAVCFALDLIRPEIIEHSSVWCCAASIVHSHADLIAGRLSLHSSSGNHTIAECAGLIFAGVLFSELRGADRWYAVGLKTLRQEAARQILTDGGGIERATWYHLFVLDLIGLVERLLDSRNHEIPAELTAALERGRAFLAVFAQSPADLPVFGDADGGYALSPFLRLSFETFAAQERLRTFPDMGLTLVRPGDQSRLTLIFDHGPLGMPPAYGHGHADALSLILRDDSGAILVDPGTYTYTGDQRWRHFFRGTRGHNTVLVDGHDQARPETPFMWSRPFVAELVAAERLEHGQVRLLARQTGYRDPGIAHWRGMLFSPEVLVVWDGMRGAGEHRFELNWHLGVDLDWVSENGCICLSDGSETGSEFQSSGSTLVLDAAEMGTLCFAHPAQSGHRRIRLLLSGGKISVHRGDTDPIRGWCSMRYGQKTESTTVSLMHRGQAPHDFLSIFCLTEASVALGDIERSVDWFRRRAF